MHQKEPMIGSQIGIVRLSEDISAASGRQENQSANRTREVRKRSERCVNNDK